MGALSKLDEFLLNPQVRTCSVAVPGTTRSSNLENQGTNEVRPSDDPGPEVEFSFPHFGAETNPHSYYFMEIVEQPEYSSLNVNEGWLFRAEHFSEKYNELCFHIILY